jgi:flagellar hook assembly protein FlgD
MRPLGWAVFVRGSEGWALVSKRLVVALAVLGAIMFPAAASSAATVAIVSPADGARYDGRFAGPMVVDFSGADAGTYTVGVTGASYGWSTTFHNDGTATRVEFAIDPVSAPGGYEARVTGPGGASAASASFFVRAAEAATVVRPEAGAVRLVGYDGPAVVRWESVDATANYGVSLDGANAPEGVICAYAGASLPLGETSCQLPKLGRGGYRVVVRNLTDDRVIATSGDFQVDALRAVSASVSPPTFYPIERDGYRDKVVLRFATNFAASNTVRIQRVANGKTIRTIKLGRQRADRTHVFEWGGKNDRGRRVKPGRYLIRLRSRNGAQRAESNAFLVRVRLLPLEITRTSVAPATFFPLERDGYRDSTRFTFAITKKARATIAIRNRAGRLVRSRTLAGVRGDRPHTVKWGGVDDRGRRLPTGTYQIRVRVENKWGQKDKSAWRSVRIAKRAPQCAASYPDFCIKPPPPDLDCADIGRSDFTVRWGVARPDPHGFDADRDGVGCESGGGGGGGGASQCAASYPDFCIAPPPPDLDCADIGRSFAVRWNVARPDPHAFDGDRDGLGCESY